MAAFLSLSVWEWLDIFGVLLVLLGVAGEIVVRRKKFQPPAVKIKAAAFSNDIDVEGLTRELDARKAAWEAENKRWEHKWEAVLIIGLAVELLAVPHHIKESAQLKKEAGGCFEACRRSERTSR